MKRVISLILWISLVLLSGCVTWRAPPYTAGQQNFVNGRYEQAFQAWYPVAQEGNPDAQYAIGYLYYYGLGTDSHRVSAIGWMQKAANQGHEQAITSVQLLLNSEDNADARVLERPRVFIISDDELKQKRSDSREPSLKPVEVSSNLAVTTLRYRQTEQAHMMPVLR